MNEFEYTQADFNKTNWFCYLSKAIENQNRKRQTAKIRTSNKIRKHVTIDG